MTQLNTQNKVISFNQHDCSNNLALFNFEVKEGNKLIYSNFSSDKIILGKLIGYFDDDSIVSYRYTYLTYNNELKGGNGLFSLYKHGKNNDIHEHWNWRLSHWEEMTNDKHQVTLKLTNLLRNKLVDYSFD